MIFSRPDLFLFLHLKLFFQANPIAIHKGVVQFVQMSFERRHVQLSVSIEVVFKQSLVDERVLHLRYEHKQLV